MPDLNGIDATRRIVAESPRIGVLMLSFTSRNGYPPRQRGKPSLRSSQRRCGPRWPTGDECPTSSPIV